MPLAALVVRRYDAPSQTLLTVAIAGPGPAEHHAAARTALTSDQLRRLLAWAAASQIRAIPRADLRRGLSFLVPPEIPGEAWAGPLLGGEGLAGALVFVAPPGASFEPRHRQLATALLEPLSVALENDWRLHELATLREVAEAERRSLLRALAGRNSARRSSAPIPD